jgi:hypothetical protein
MSKGMVAQQVLLLLLIVFTTHRSYDHGLSVTRDTYVQARYSQQITPTLFECMRFCPTCSSYHHQLSHFHPIPSTLLTSVQSESYDRNP